MEHGDDAPHPGQEPDDAELRALRETLGPLFDHARPPALLRDRLRREARSRFAPMPALRLLPRIAAACAAAALAWLLVTADRTGGPRDTSVAERPPAMDAADVDGSGRVDIFDAYLVARAVREGDPGGLPDLDGDGLVTEGDADLIAARAVELSR